MCDMRMAPIVALATPGGFLVGVGLAIGAVVTAPIWIPYKIGQWAKRKIERKINRAYPKYTNAPWIYDRHTTDHENKAVRYAIGDSDDSWVNLPTREEKTLDRLKEMGCKIGKPISVYANFSTNSPLDKMTQVKLPRRWHIVFPEEQDCRKWSIRDDKNKERVYVFYAPVPNNYESYVIFRS